MKRAFFLSLIIHLGLFALFFYVTSKSGIIREKNSASEISLNLKKFEIKKEKPKEKKTASKPHPSKIKRKRVKKEQPKTKPKPHKKIVEKKPIFKPEQKQKVKNESISKPKPIIKPEPKTASKPKDIQKSMHKNISNLQSSSKLKTKQAENRISKKSDTCKKSAQSSSDFNIFLAQIRDTIERFKYYPRIAKRLHKQGIVTVYFRLKPDGDIEDLKVVKSAGTLLDRAALNCIKKASNYFPKPKKEIEIKVPLEYRLK